MNLFVTFVTIYVTVELLGLNFFALLQYMFHCHIFICSQYAIRLLILPTVIATVFRTLEYI